MDDNFKTTHRKPISKMGKKLEKNFSSELDAGGIQLQEVDLELNEKEESLKKKIWDLSKMESLVHADPKLSAKYHEMAEEGEETYGYHYNETIMNILFNDYVMNSPKYLEKYKNAIPAKKKRRDKSGIEQLEKKGQEKMDKKSDAKNEDDVKIHNNSLEGVIEEDGVMNNNLNTDGGGTFDDREYLTKSINKIYDTTPNTMDENISNTDPTYKEMEKYLWDYMGGWSDKDEQFNVEEAIYWFAYSYHNGQNSNLYSALSTSQYKPSPLINNPDDLKSHESWNYYKALVDKFGENAVDETTTAASSGAYSPKLGAKAKDNVYENMNLESAKKEAQKISKEEGVAQHVNQIGNDQYKIDDFFDSDSTVASFENGRPLNEDKRKDDPCWDNYKQVGMKEKNGKEVPNCVPESEEKEEDKGKVNELHGEYDGEYEAEKAEFNRDLEKNDPSDEQLAQAAQAQKEIDKENNKEEVDETTTSASSGSYETKFAWSKDGKPKKHGKNPAWAGGEIIGEGFMVNTEFFKDIVNGLNEGMNSPNNDSRVPMAEHHLESREEKINFIVQNSNGGFTQEMLNDVTDEGIDNIYRDLESDIGLHEDNMQQQENIMSPEEVLYDKMKKYGYYRDDLKDFAEIFIEHLIVDNGETHLAKQDIVMGKNYPLGELAEFIVYGKNSKVPENLRSEYFKEIIKIFDNKLNGQVVRRIPISGIRDIDGVVQENIDEKSVSKNQQQFMGMVHAHKKGEMPDASDSVKKAAASMSDEDALDFASTKHKGLPNKVEEDATDYERKILKFGEAQQLANALDNAPVEQEERIINKFLENKSMSANELRNQIQNHLNSMAGSESPDFFKMEYVVTVLNDMMDQVIDKERAKDKEDALNAFHRTPHGRAERDKEAAMGEGIDEAANPDMYTTKEDLDHLIKITKERTGKGLTKDHIPMLAGDALYTMAIKIADRMLPLSWDDMGDTNSMWDYIDQNGGMKYEDFIRGVKEAVKDRMDGEGFGNMFESVHDTVEYDSERSGEEPFEIGGEKWQFVNAIYPDGKKDIGVYRYGHDLVYDYDWFRKNVLGEGVISDNPTTMISTMKNTGMGSSSMGSMSMGEGADIENDKTIDPSKDENELSDFGTSDDGVGGFNGKGDGYPKNYKNPSVYKDEIKESKEDHPYGKCDNCGSPLNEDGHCRRDEVPVAGKVAGQKGSCKKKHKTDKFTTHDNKYNVKARKEREKEKMERIDKKDKDYEKELENNRKQMKKIKEMQEIGDDKPVVSEDKRPSALVQLDRLKKDNSKNFKSDLKDSNTDDLTKQADEMKASEQTTEVGDNPYDLAEKIEKEKMKDHKFDSFENEGNSTNDNNKEIPKRNATDDEAEDIMKDRGLGMQDIVYDNKPDERFEERMEKDMGEDIYKQRQEKMDYRAEAPMYNKDTQPTDDDSIEKDQFEKNITKFNSRKGVDENRYVNAKYVDDLNKSRVVTFALKECVEVDKPSENAFKMNLEGMGNRYTQKVDEDTSMRGLMDEVEFFFNGKNVEMVGKPKQRLSESTKKENSNKNLEKMLKLSDYNPNTYIKTTNVKKNRGF